MKQIISKNASIELHDGDLVAEVEMSAKSAWVSQVPTLGSFYDYYLKAIQIRGINTTANGYVQFSFCSKAFVGDTQSSTFTSGKIYGAEVSHLVVPCQEFSSSAEFSPVSNVNQKLRLGGFMEAFILPGSTWTGVVHVKYIFTRDNTYVSDE